MALIEAEITLRDRNQLTVPKDIAEASGLHEGQRLVVTFHADFPNQITIRPLPDSYAGILTGIYGTTEAERTAYVRGEQDDWD